MSSSLFQRRTMVYDSLRRTQKPERTWLHFGYVPSSFYCVLEPRLSFCNVFHSPRLPSNISLCISHSSPNPTAKCSSATRARCSNLLVPAGDEGLALSSWSLLSLLLLSSSLFPCSVQCWRCSLVVDVVLTSQATAIAGVPPMAVGATAGQEPLQDDTLLEVRHQPPGVRA